MNWFLKRRGKKRLACEWTENVCWARCRHSLPCSAMCVSLCYILYVPTISLTYSIRCVDWPFSFTTLHGVSTSFSNDTATAFFFVNFVIVASACLLDMGPILINWPDFIHYSTISLCKSDGGKIQINPIQSKKTSSMKRDHQKKIGTHKKVFGINLNFLCHALSPA